MQIVMLGLSHDTAPVGVREMAAIDEKQVPGCLNRLFGRPDIHEAAILSTCNRTELYAVTGGSADGAELRRFLAEEKALDPRILDEHTYVLEGRAAVEHLFRVAAGLESLILGEGQILSQVKDAHATAQLHRTLGTVLDNLFRHAISAGKLVRTQTDISRGAVSVSSAAVELARDTLGTLEGRQVVILGSGKMSELAARQLSGFGVGAITVANRSLEAAEALARQVGGVAVPFTELGATLGSADVVFCATGAPHYVLHAPDVAGVRQGSQRPCIYIDISLPRNIDPEVGKLPGVRLYDMDALEQVAARNRAERSTLAEEAALMLEVEVGRFQVWLKNFRMTPTISSLRHKVEEIRRQEVERFAGKFDADQLSAVEELTRAIANKLLHDPTVRLKALPPVEQQQVAAVLQDLFGLKVEEIGERYLRKLRARAASGRPEDETDATQFRAES